MKTAFFLILLTLLGLTSCDPAGYYDKFADTGDGSWTWDENQIFSLNVEDTLQPYNVYLNIRHTKEYPRSNLYVFLSITGPNNSTTRDTVNIPIADKRGKWYGDGFGNIRLVRHLYRKDIRFPFTGEYTFEIEQAMRIDEVPVTDVGIRIEKFNRYR
jgi:gliding motility-associated lipoprotein GldH